MATEDMDKDKFIIQCKVGLIVLPKLIFFSEGENKSRWESNCLISVVTLDKLAFFQGKLMLLSKFEKENPFFKR